MSKDWWLPDSDQEDYSELIDNFIGRSGVIFEWGTLAKGERPKHSVHDDRVVMWYPEAYREICRRYWGTPGRLGLAHFIKTSSKSTVLDYAKDVFTLCVGEYGIVVGFRVTAEENLSNGYPVYILDWAVG